MQRLKSVMLFVKVNGTTITKGDGKYRILQCYNINKGTTNIITTCANFFQYLDVKTLSN